MKTYKELMDLFEDYGPVEQSNMAETQLHFIIYAAEEVLECIKNGMVIEEWYQNKLAKIHGDMESLHSHMEGKKRRLGVCGGDNSMPHTQFGESYDLDDIITEELDVDDGIGAWIKDFQDSDAPQFKGKSKEKRRQMAIAAFLDAKRGRR